jgi:hypothetical protein
MDTSLADSALGNSRCLQQSTNNVQLANTITPQVVGEPSTVDVTQKRKKTLAAFQLQKNAIPLDAGHIKVSF